MYGFTLIARDDRHVGGCPACDVDRSDVVGVVRETARLATELGLAPAVGLVDVVATRTGARRVAWIDRDNWHTRKCTFVGQERPELEERPSGVHRSLALLDRYPTADTQEILQGDSTAGAFGLGDDVLRNGVVHVGTKTGLVPRETLEMPLGRLGSAGLEIGSQLVHPLAHGFDARAAVVFPVGVHGEIADAEVNTQPIFGIDGCAVGHFHGDVEEPLALAEHEVSLPTDTFAPVATCRASLR